MKNKIAKVGLCVFAAGLLFTNSVYGAQLAQEYDDNVSAITNTSTAFWRKKDKETAPSKETPQASPTPSTAPTGAPKDTPKGAPKTAPKETPQASPVAAPKEAPQTAPKETPKETSENDVDSETALVRYYQNNGGQNQGQQGQQGQHQNQQNQQTQPTQHNQQNQQNQYNQPNQQRQNSNQGQSQGQMGGYYHYNNADAGQRTTSFAPGIGEEIQRILENQPSIQLDPNAYIVQHDDSLWLVMGNIRAKLDILIYVDQKNMKEAELNHSNAIPLYK